MQPNFEYSELKAAQNLFFASVKETLNTLPLTIVRPKYFVSRTQGISPNLLVTTEQSEKHLGPILRQQDFFAFSFKLIASSSSQQNLIINLSSAIDGASRTKSSAYMNELY